MKKGSLDVIFVFGFFLFTSCVIYQKFRKVLWKVKWTEKRHGMGIYICRVTYSPFYHSFHVESQCERGSHSQNAISFVDPNAPSSSSCVSFRSGHFTRIRNRPKKAWPDLKPIRSFYPIGFCCEGPGVLDPTRPELKIRVRYPKTWNF